MVAIVSQIDSEPVKLHAYMRIIKFLHIRLPTDFSKPIQVDLPISHAGAFVYWVEYDGDAPGERVKGREGYFNIDPILHTKARTPIFSSELTPLSPSAGGAAIQPESINLPLDGLTILTVVSKWMGPLSTWREYFAEASDRGYTMLHYPPLQERGESDSPYSIREQMKYDPSMFDGKMDADGGKAKIEAILKVAREDYGLLSLTDVVLNHTANDSPWLIEHPEAGQYQHICTATLIDVLLQVLVQRTALTLPQRWILTLRCSNSQLLLRLKGYQYASHLSRTWTPSSMPSRKMLKS